MNAYFIYNFKIVTCHYLIFPELGFFKFHFKLGVTVFLFFFKGMYKHCIKK